MRGAAGASFVVVSGVCWLVPAVLSAWGILELRDHGPALVAAGCFAAVVLGCVAAVVRLATGNAERTAAALSGLLASWIGLLVCGFGMQEQQLLHDRGVTSEAEVVRTVVGSDPMAGQGPSVTGADVRLADGTEVAGIGTGGRRVALGDRLQVTVDPRGTVDPRLGPRPGPADRTVAVVLLVVMAGLALFGGAAMADEL
ncbi:hypothetical protein ACFWA9_15140 [Kitasatospora sp. NPDC059973]|uniref:hypothetical protein n=1 Tax=Kitasatospora sp. NPDC059973 TaxID=3347020 RepID=UPI0036AD52C3